MISLDKREHTERERSAFEASQATTDLQLPPATIARYQKPPATTIFPLEYAFHLLGDATGKTVLEYGCGDGLNTVVLANRGARVVALDISPDLLEITRRRLQANKCEGVDLLLGSGHTLPMADESVDIVFGMAILHHLDLELASREVFRVLKKGGKAIFEEPTRNSKLANRLRALFPKRADVSPFERPLTTAEMERFAEPCAFKAKTFQPFVTSLTSLAPHWLRPSTRVSAKVDARLLRLFPFLDYYATITVFEMTK